MRKVIRIIDKTVVGEDTPCLGALGLSVDLLKAIELLKKNGFEIELTDDIKTTLSSLVTEDIENWTTLYKEDLNNKYDCLSDEDKQLLFEKILDDVLEVDTDIFDCSYISHIVESDLYCEFLLEDDLKKQEEEE